MECEPHKLQNMKADQDKGKCKGCKLNHVKNCLQNSLNFLKNYLPLANVHSNEFLTKNVWENFLPESIRNELLNLSDKDLIDLSCYSENVRVKIRNDYKEIEDQINNTVTQNFKDMESIEEKFKVIEMSAHSGCRNKEDNVETSYNAEEVEAETKCSCGQCVLNKHDSWTFECPYLEQAPKVKNRSKLIKGFRPTWTHSDLVSFLQDSKLHTLETLDVGCSLLKFFSKFRISDVDDRIFISHIMNMKKSHEVDIMGDVCSLLAKHHGIDMVIDMGSGKGYLSAHLTLQHKLLVVAIDAIQTNTTGALKRADKLTKHWNGLVRNAIEDKNRGYKIKRSKKWKKKMKLAAVKGDKSFAVPKKEKQSTDEDNEKDLVDFQNLFDPDEEENEEKNFDFVSYKEVLNEKEFMSKPLVEVEMLYENKQSELKSNETTLHAHEESDYQHALFQKEVKEENSNIQLLEHDFSDKLKSKDTKAKLGTRNELLFPLTMYVDSTMDLNEVVNTALEGSHISFGHSGSRDTSLMLTGLHTCGGLGSSILQLFVNNPQAKVMCSVGCCYHLMEEEFVCAPFDENDGDGEELSGFPLSKFLRDNKVGLGRVARNFASQSVNRMAKETELKSKAFPRSLLQKIIVDIIGYVREDWKGLRKLDQKCKNMYEYVLRAFCKFGLPTDKLTPELVQEYVEKYKDEERKLAAFHNLKTMIAPCIEAVVILDRICYLLEQECVADVDLVQLFDPVTSPRCYGIIAYKKDICETLIV